MAIFLPYLLPLHSAELDLLAIACGHLTRPSLVPWRLPLTNKRGRRPLTFLDIVARDAELDLCDVRGAMLDRAVWKQIVDGISIEDRPK